jgi:hypothetical protein
MQLKHLEMSMFRPNETFKIQPIPIKTLTKKIIFENLFISHLFECPQSNLSIEVVKSYATNIF